MQNRVYKTREIVEAGLITAILIVMMLFNIYVPIFSTIANFILPIPITVLYIRHNYKVTLICLAASGVMISMFNNPIIGILNVVIMGLTGMAMGYCVKKKIEYYKSITILAISFIISNVISFYIQSYLVYKGGITQLIKQTINEYNEIMQVISNMSLPKENLDSLNKIMSIITPEFIMLLIPASLIVMGYVMAYISYKITKAILQRLKIEVIDLIPFSHICISVRAMAVVVSFIFIGYLMNKFKLPGAETVKMSASFLIQYMLLLNGITLFTYFLRSKYKLSKPIVILIIIFTVLTPLGNGYIIVGLVDVIFDFRKLNPYKFRIKK